MTINLSEKTVNTVLISLRDAKKSLERQINRTTNVNKLDVLNEQLEDVLDALAVFEEVQQWKQYSEQ